jgi:hypothetical protein
VRKCQSGHRWKSSWGQPLFSVLSGQSGISHSTEQLKFLRSNCCKICRPSSSPLEWEYASFREKLSYFSLV